MKIVIMHVGHTDVVLTGWFLVLSAIAIIFGASAGGRS